jgi:hypothetical protein
MSSWFVRRASNDTILVSIDPEPKLICGQPVRWLDNVRVQDRCLGPETFVDFMKIDWNAKMDEYADFIMTASTTHIIYCISQTPLPFIY